MYVTFQKNQAMKQLTTFILLFACLATQSQSWDWQWTRQLKGADGAWCQVVATDNLNQSYLVATYEDTLVMGDTTFRHPYKYNQMQSVIGIYDQFGKFRKAMDFYSPAGYQPIPVSVKPENSHSILVGGTYSDEYLVSDTTLYTQNQNVEAFIGKYNEQGKHQWVKTIKGPNQDYLINFIPAGNGTSYVIGQHTANLTPVWVNFFGADSIEHNQSLIYVLKLDSLGNIIWRRACISFWCNEVNGVGAAMGADGNIYVQGFTRCHLVLGQDTIRHSGGTEAENFIYAYDGQGNLVNKQMRKGSLQMGNISVDSEHNIFFGGIIHKTTYFSNDTVVIPQGHYPCILGKMDLQNNLLWYQLYDPPYYGSYHWLEFSIASDTIYAALTIDGGMIFGDSTYSAQGRRTMIMQYSMDGTLHEVNMLQGNNSNYSYRVIADHCSDLVIGGLFTGMAYNGADTLKTSRAFEGYIGRIKRWTHAIDIGPDTVINHSASISLSAGNDYDSYQWSTGEHASSIVVTGSELGAGPHKIGVSVYKDGCESRDTILVTVKNNIGIADLGSQSGLFQIYPNPITDFAIIEYELPVEAQVQIKIFDFTGRQVALIVDQKQQTGKYKIRYDTHDQKPGIYYYQMRNEDKIETKKMIITNRPQNE